jgi:hypothetical protein
MHRVSSLASAKRSRDPWRDADSASTSGPDGDAERLLPASDAPAVSAFGKSDESHVRSEISCFSSQPRNRPEPALCVGSVGPDEAVANAQSVRAAINVAGCVRRLHQKTAAVGSNRKRQLTGRYVAWPRVNPAKQMLPAGTLSLGRAVG